MRWLVLKGSALGTFGLGARGRYGGQGLGRGRAYRAKQVRAMKGGMDRYGAGARARKLGASLRARPACSGADADKSRRQTGVGRWVGGSPPAGPASLEWEQRGVLLEPQYQAGGRGQHCAVVGGREGGGAGPWSAWGRTWGAAGRKEDWRGQAACMKWGARRENWRRGGCPAPRGLAIGGLQCGRWGARGRGRRRRDSAGLGGSRRGCTWVQC